MVQRPWVHSSKKRKFKKKIERQRNYLPTCWSHTVSKTTKVMTLLAGTVKTGLWLNFWWNTNWAGVQEWREADEGGKEEIKAVHTHETVNKEGLKRRMAN